MIVPVSAGSQTDIMARMIGQKLNERWGQQIVVDPRPSAGGTIAGGILASAPPDGHTLLLHSVSFAVNATLYGKLPYDTLRDISGVTQVGSVPNVLVVSPSSGIRSVKDLIAAAKESPGKLNFGSAGIGTGTHMNGELFKISAAVNVVHVPYKGMPEALTDTATGRIHYSFASLTPAVPFIRDKRLTALAVSTAVRTPILPDVPTVAEAALPGFEFDLWLGVLAPSKTPKPLLNFISQEIRTIVELPDIKERMLAQGAVPKTSTPEEFDRFIRSEVERLGKVIKAAGLRAD
jgi:tripartite-type tricarboxylate transporter receptor subunit TctC